MKIRNIMKEKKVMVGSEIGFEAQEAYNLLRANLLLSFSDDKKCRRLGITSAMHGDGKSVTAINTAYSLALAGKKVLLMEGDLRLPTISTNLKIKQIPGISNYLTGQCEMGAMIRREIMSANLDIAAAGEIPPNPSELLGSEKMRNLLEELTETYDFILVDMPPVGAVSDAIVLSSILDGMLLVVRHNYTDRSLLLKMMSQFEYADIKVLGFILNDFSSHGTGYYKHTKKRYGKYKKYYLKEEKTIK